MYTQDQYRRAVAQVDSLAPEDQARIRPKIEEYQREHNRGAHGPAAEPTLDPLTVKAQLEGAAAATPAAQQQTEALVANAPPPGADPRYDHDLPNASGLKRLNVPPEYTAKDWRNGFKHVAVATLKDPLDGPGVGTYHEPSAQQFVADQHALLAAWGIPADPNNEQFQDQFAEYKDRKWKQAYEKAAAADQPLTRAEYVPHSRSWDKLKTALEVAPDMASTFAKGFARAATLHGTDMLAAGSDALTGRDDVGNDRAQTERNPGTEAAGELVGAARPTGLLAGATEGAANVGAKVIPGAVGRIAGSALGGAVAGELDNAGRAVAQGFGDVAHGHSLESAKDAFTSHLLSSGLVGGGFGALGGAAAEGAGLFRRGFKTTDAGREAHALEQGGGATGLIRGVTPPKAVAENIEAARPPLPGENKPNLETTPVDLAASRLHEPLTAQSANDNTAYRARADRENAAAYAADPNLQEPKPARSIVNEIIDKIKTRSREETGAEIPVNEALPSFDNKGLVNLLRQSTKARVMTAVEAADAAKATGGRVVSMEEANALGYDVSPHAPDPESGVPPDAPDLEEPGEPTGRAPGGGPRPGAPPAPGDANPVRLLPRYSKEDLAQHAAPASADPATAAALRRYTFGKRDPGDEALIDQHLQTAPPSGLPHVYRGLVMPEDKAAQFLSQPDFELGSKATSVSADPITARSFVARNQEPGTVGITLKLQHNSARDIQPYADPQVSVEKELLVPGKTRFQVVSKHPDPTNPGNWIVVGKEVPTSRPPLPGEGLPPRKPPPPSGGAADYAPDENGDWSPVTATPAAKQAQAAGVPAHQLRVLIEPRSFNAKKYETIIGGLDDMAKAGARTGPVDKAWEDFQRAAREDREQFSSSWADLKDKHYREQLALEQRAGHANIAKGNKPYSEMDPDAQKAFAGSLPKYGTPAASKDQNDAYRALADAAGPKVRAELETLRAQTAYDSLKTKATPNLRESAGASGTALRVGGLGTATKLRADAVARGISRGPKGLPPGIDPSKFSPELRALLRQGNPIAREYKPVGTMANMFSMGKGSLGLKASSVYNSLTPDEEKTLAGLLAAEGKAK